jgi:hypothetical protein
MDQNYIVLWSLLSFVFLMLGTGCVELERKSRGKGTWAPDRILLQLSGAFWALSVVCYALFIACCFA